MAEASVTFAVGSEQATVVLPVDLPVGETIIIGDFGGLVAAGTTARFRGDVNLTGNIHVRGTLTCDEVGVNVNGNGFDIHTHDGTLNLVGTEKTAWLTWGDIPVGWQVGDRLAVAATKVGIWAPTEMTWSGSWATMTRPVNSLDVTLVDGSIRKPEVANLSQTVTLRNMQRIMVHEASAPNPQTFKWIRVLDSGEVGVLGMYPIHFHMIGEHARGSIHEGVVVEGGKNHAYVPHGSHGITYKDCVAYNTIQDAYWWDPPEENNQPSLNDTDDVLYDHCLALKVNGPPGGPTAVRLAGFTLGRGINPRCINSVASGVIGGKSASGFNWPERGIAAWEFTGCTAHNNKFNGIFAWPNTHLDHVVEEFTAYHCGRAGIEHGAYVTRFAYKDVTITVGTPSVATAAVWQHANGQDTGLLFEDFITNDRLIVDSHGLPPTEWATYRRCLFTGVMYDEVLVGGAQVFPSWIRFEDCGLEPADFTFTSIFPESKIELVEAGVLTHQWGNGAWS